MLKNVGYPAAIIFTIDSAVSLKYKYLLTGLSVSIERNFACANRAGFVHKWRISITSWGLEHEENNI